MGASAVSNFVQGFTVHISEVEENPPSLVRVEEFSRMMRNGEGEGESVNVASLPLRDRELSKARRMIKLGSEELLCVDVHVRNNTTRLGSYPSADHLGTRLSLMNVGITFSAGGFISLLMDEYSWCGNTIPSWLKGRGLDDNKNYGYPAVRIANEEGHP